MIEVTLRASENKVGCLVLGLFSPSWFDQARPCSQEYDTILDQIVAIIEGRETNTLFDVLSDDLSEVETEGDFSVSRFILTLVDRGVVVTEGLEDTWFDQPLLRVPANGLSLLNEAVDEALQEACFGDVIYG